MSLHSYRESVRIAKQEPQFHALVMAAMRKADSQNEALLKRAFPQVWAELEARYHAPHGGLLPGEKDPDDGWGRRRSDGVLVTPDGEPVFWPAEDHQHDHDPED